MVRMGGLYVNFERMESTDEMFNKDKHVVAENTTIIRIGETTKDHCTRMLSYPLQGKSRMR